MDQKKLTIIRTHLITPQVKVYLLVKDVLIKLSSISLDITLDNLSTNFYRISYSKYSIPPNLMECFFDLIHIQIV
jgi:hypothetical protein